MCTNTSHWYSIPHLHRKSLLSVLFVVVVVVIVAIVFVVFFVFLFFLSFRLYFFCGPVLTGKSCFWKQIWHGLLRLYLTSVSFLLLLLFPPAVSIHI